MNMQIILLEHIRLVRIHALDQTDGNLYRFLHHIAELAGNINFSFTLGEHGFQKQNVAARLCPRQARDNARHTGFHRRIMPHRLAVEHFFELPCADRDGCVFSLDQFDRGAAAQRIYALFESAHAGFYRVIRDNFAKRAIRDMELLRRNARALHRPRQQMFFGNLQLFRCRIALKLNDLHAVEQRLRNRIQRICRADKQHIGQIIRHVHVVVGERAVLLWIQHLQQRTGRVAIVILAQLIYLVQHHNRIGCAAAPNAVHDSARHRADIGASVSANFRLIAHAAETDTRIRTLERSGNALANAGLARARRTDKQQN